MPKVHPGHVVCIFGGAVAGSEAAHRLAKRGIYSVVFDQEALPYGKIEHGLPKWHIKLRDKEEEKIDEKMSDPYVLFVPSTKLGRDISFEEIPGWGFSAVLLAIGAWRDRPLPVEGVDDFIDRGFYYQNPYVMWFNQYHSPDYKLPEMEVLDETIVIGGGLASLDVVKILMLETTLRALRERGFKTDLFTLDKKGIPKVLQELGVEWESLGLKGCRLFYRRRVIDMPLNEIPEGTPPEKAERMKQVRGKLLGNFQRKFLFDFQPQRVPVSKIVKDGRLVGLIFQKTEIRDGRAVAVEGSEFEVRSPLTISSIGSLPEPIAGLEMKWNLLQVDDEETGKLTGFENVFALGNTVTGRGNIRASLVHGRQVADHVLDEFLAWSEDDYRRLMEESCERSRQQADRIAVWVEAKHLKSSEQVQALRSKAAELQARRGFDGDYRKWADSNRPKRLEDLIGYEA